MRTITVSKDDIIASLDAALDRWRVMAPTMKNGLYVFDWIERAADVRLSYDQVPQAPPKAALLPRTEVLFAYRTGKDGETVMPAPDARPQVLFGLLSCDVQALRVLDAVFGSEPFPDEPYVSRREVTTVVGLGIPVGWRPPGSFFEQLGISAMDSSGSDVFLAEIAHGRFVAEILTGKGEEFATCFGGAREASGEDLARLGALRQEAGSKAGGELTAESFYEKVDEMFDSALWDEIGERCAGCGVCTYLCPTCHCFDIQDETYRGVGARVRNWDTCQFELFTQQASGHNPRPGRNPRVRQRILHKFQYGPRNKGIPFCVGCGRCVLYCPVNIDLRRILEDIRSRNPS